MRRIYLKAWWSIIPCSGRKCLKTESQRDIAEILQSKLSTIIEEDTEGLLLTPFNELTHLRTHEQVDSQSKQSVKLGRCFKSELSLKDLYEVVVTGFSNKRSFAVARLIRN
ncbi:hypothetical protein QQ045_032539 [Rhodiola kirilowii]